MITQSVGTYTSQGDTRTVTFVRSIKAPQERLWNAITDPGQLSQWLGTAEVEPKAGGRISLDMEPGKPGHPFLGSVLAFDPISLFEFEWNYPGEAASVVRIELRPEETGTELTLIHRGISPELPAYGPGWHAFLDSLEGQVTDTPTDWMASFRAAGPLYGVDIDALFGQS